MRTTLLLALLLAIPSALRAQMPNNGFEEWDVDGAFRMPVGWSGTRYGIGQDSSAYSGNYAVSVWTWYNYATGTVGTAIPFDFVPERLTGFYKFVQDGAPDSARATVMIRFTKYDSVTGRSEEVASVKTFLPPRDEWGAFEIDIPPLDSGVVPDSISISFHSTDPYRTSRVSCYLGTNECCYLSIDDVTFETTSGVSRAIEFLRSPVRIVPNPVTTTSALLQFSGEPGKRYRVKVHDVSGRPVLERDVIGSEADLTGLQLPSGTYHVSVLDEGNVPVATGRFVLE